MLGFRTMPVLLKSTLILVLNIVSEYINQMHRILMMCRSVLSSNKLWLKGWYGSNSLKDKAAVKDRIQ